MGPRTSAGTKVSTPTIIITLVSSSANMDPPVENVPAEGGADFLPAREPAMATLKKVA